MTVGEFVDQYCDPVLGDLGYRRRTRRFWYTAQSGAVVHIAFQKVDHRSLVIEMLFSFVPTTQAAERQSFGETPPFMDDAKLSWGSIDAPPGFALAPQNSARQWVTERPGCGAQARRVLAGAASILRDYADRGEWPPRPGVPSDNTIGTFNMPQYGGGEWVRRFLHSDTDRDGIRAMLAEMTRLFPGNEWVAHWAEVAAHP